MQGKLVNLRVVPERRLPIDKCDQQSAEKYDIKGRASLMVRCHSCEHIRNILY